MTTPAGSPGTEQAQWHVKQEANGQQRTLFSGLEREARKFITNNFPRPHLRQGEDGAHADVQLYGPDGSQYEFLGEGAVGADDNGFVTTQAGSTVVADDNDDNTVPVSE